MIGYHGGMTALPAAIPAASFAAVAALWLALANGVGFALMLSDKRRARAHQRRIPERTLLGWSLLGGSAGTLAGSIVARHKTRKRPIAFLLRAIPPVQLLLALALWLGWLPAPISLS